MKRALRESSILSCLVPPGGQRSNCTLIRRWIRSNAAKKGSTEREHTLVQSLTEARRILEQWWFEYNEMRPHSSLGNRAPAVYVAELLGVGSSSPVQEVRFLTL